MQQNKSLHTAHEAAESKSDWMITKPVKTVKTMYFNHIVWFTRQKQKAWSDAQWQPWLSASIQIHNLAFLFQLTIVQVAKTMFVIMNIMLSWKYVFELVCDQLLGWCMKQA